VTIEPSLADDEAQDLIRDRWTRTVLDAYCPNRTTGGWQDDPDLAQLIVDVRAGMLAAMDYAITFSGGWRGYQRPFYDGDRTAVDPQFVALATWWLARSCWVEVDDDDGVVRMRL
jgi:hypothetical protein